MCILWVSDLQFYTQKGNSQLVTSISLRRWPWVRGSVPSIWKVIQRNWWHFPPPGSFQGDKEIASQVWRTLEGAQLQAGSERPGMECFFPGLWFFPGPLGCLACVSSPSSLGLLVLAAVSLSAFKGIQGPFKDTFLQMILFLTLTQGSIYCRKAAREGLVMQGGAETALSEYSCNQDLLHHLEIFIISLDQVEACSYGATFPDRNLPNWL